ncbi:MAG: WYL domain-containing protein [Firmicutes bacterium]|nr:WYL domain-containing protein [Bacillota bacterium]
MAQTKGKVQLTEDRNDNAILSDSMLTLSRIAVCLKSFGEEEYFTATDLLTRLERRYGEGVLSKDTVTKALTILENETEKYNSIFDFVLEKYIHQKKEYILYNDYLDELDASGENEDNSKDARPGAKFYYKVLPNVTKAEVKMLADAISSFTMLTMGQTKVLLEDLNRLANDPQHHIITNVKDDGYPYKLDDNQRAQDIINSIDTVMKALKQHRCISFDYYQYTTKKVSASVYELDFEKRSQQRIHPAFFVWSNGYYYLIGKSIGRETEDFIVFRVDRIRSMTVLEKCPALTFDINPARYRDENPVMYGGSKEEIVLRIRRTRLNNAVDAFGKNFMIFPSSFVDPKTGESDQWIELRFVANPKGVALWATQHCTEACVLKPDHLAETVRNNLNAGLALYDQN